MRRACYEMLALMCGVLLAGCRESGDTTKPAFLGRWTTSTSPELSSTRTTMAFLESGEFQFSSAMSISGRMIVGKVDGKDIPARLVASGIWERAGDRILVRITQTNQTSVKFEGPWEYKIISKTDRNLVLKRQEEIIALFREE